MATYALIVDNTVKNVILCDPDLIEPVAGGADYVDLSEVSPQPSIGWSYVDGVFAAPPPTYPAVTQKQIRLALVLSGHDSSLIDDAIAAMTSPDRELADIEWNYTITFERTNPLVVAVAVALGWSDEQANAIWLLADSL